VGKLRDGDMIRITVDRNRLEGRVDLVGEAGAVVSEQEGNRILAERQPRADLAPDPDLPEHTRVWAALQQVSGGSWGGAVYDAEAILKVIEAGRKALSGNQKS